MACHLLVRRVPISNSDGAFRRGESLGVASSGLEEGEKSKREGSVLATTITWDFILNFLYCHVEDSKLVTINLYFYADITLFSYGEQVHPTNNHHKS